jgi:hypothetical protein
MPVDDVNRGDRPRSISTPAQYVRDYKKWDNIAERQASLNDCHNESHNGARAG